MWVKSIKPGMYDLAQTGGFVHVVVGTVFRVPDDMPLDAGTWIVRCDEQGNIMDMSIVKNTADNARAAATRARGEAQVAADKAKAAEALAAAEEAKVAALEKRDADEAAKIAAAEEEKAKKSKSK